MRITPPEWFIPFGGSVPRPCCASGPEGLLEVPLFHFLEETIAFLLLLDACFVSWNILEMRIVLLAEIFRDFRRRSRLCGVLLRERGELSRIHRFWPPGDG